jgi:hypothetical protein
MGEVSSQLLLTIVGNDPEADPALLPSSPRYRQRCRPSALAHTDASLAPGTPSLPVAEPSLLLLSLVRGALAGAIGDADPFDTFGLRRSLVLAGIEPGISGDKARYTSQFCCVHLAKSPASADPIHWGAEAAERADAFGGPAGQQPAIGG